MSRVVLAAAVASFRHTDDSARAVTLAVPILALLSSCGLVRSSVVALVERRPPVKPHDRSRGRRSEKANLHSTDMEDHAGADDGREREGVSLRVLMVETDATSCGAIGLAD